MALGATLCPLSSVTVWGAPVIPIRAGLFADWQPTQVSGTITHRQLPLGVMK